MDEITADIAAHNAGSCRPGLRNMDDCSLHLSGELNSLHGQSLTASLPFILCLIKAGHCPFADMS